MKKLNNRGLVQFKCINNIYDEVYKNGAKSQKRVFRDFDNIKKCANAGYKVFNIIKNEIYPVAGASVKNIDVLAGEVIAGNWGNGSDRINDMIIIP